MTSLRFAITGTTSGVGHRFAEVLRAAGHRVVGLVRNPERADAKRLGELGVELVVGDLDDRAALASLARGADIFVHMAAHVGDWGPPEQFVRVNVLGTEHALSAAKQAGVRRFVQLSSTSVYGRPDSGRVDESWPTRHCGLPYEDTKTDAERTVFAFAERTGLEVTAIRPPIIYGPYDRNFMPRMAEALRQGRFLLIDGGKAPLNLVWVDHVTDLLLLAATHEHAKGQVFNVMDEVSDRPPCVRDVANVVADAIGAKRPSFSLPFSLAYGIGHLALGAFRLAKAKGPPPVSPFVVKILTRDVVYNASKAVRVLGWRPRIRSLEGVAREAASFARRSGH